MTTAPQPAVLTTADLANRPADWLDQLQQAASRANTKQLLHLIAQIPATDSPLAEKLTQLVNNFSFEEIVDLIQ